MEKIMNLTLKEILDMGAQIDVHFHNGETDEEAKENLAPFEALGSHKKRSSGRLNWLKIVTDNIEVTSFYETPIEPDETEIARANLTEWERKHKEAGVKEVDFR